MDDLLRDFLTESADNLAQLDLDIVELERNPESAELVNRIFRAIHTIKGTCGFIGLSRLEGVAHVTESVLMLVRDRELGVEQAVIDAVLAGVDVIKSILASLEQTEQEPAGDDTALIARLEQWIAFAQNGGPRPDAASTPVVQEAIPIGADAEPSAVENSKQTVADSTLRVNVVLLDKLMNMVGELVLARNQLMQLASRDEDATLGTSVQHLDRVTTDLQEAVMRTRMQPIGGAWTKLPRLVRDLAAASGKQIDLEMSGAETELDRQILQAIQDPLTHIIRNSGDHGIERPEVRTAKGKPAKGHIRLNAYHDGGHVILEVSDDGAGIDVERVRQKAIDRGLVKADAAVAMNDAQVLRFIFEPGFSTAQQITSVSGRGVGMDVVRSNIERIGGMVELHSRPGQGTTIRIKIPLTLAIISALLVASASHLFAIPQIGVVELVRITEEQQAKLENVHGARFYRLRDSLLPLVELAPLLAINSDARPNEYSIVVCQVGDHRFGLVVDEVFDTQEIVVKPIGRLVKHLAVYSGCTILGDGRVIMILDPTGIASAASIGVQSERSASRERESVVTVEGADRESILLFDAAFPALQAVPLSRVARLEEISASQIEEADGQLLVQYRGALLPIVAANPSMVVRARDPRPVIVFSHEGRSIGLAVDEIRDIVDEVLRVEPASRRAGLLGVAVIAGRATDVIDTSHFLRQVSASVAQEAA